MPNLLAIVTIALVPTAAFADHGPPSQTVPTPSQQPQVDEPCAHGKWSDRWGAGKRRPRIAIGLAKGHVELGDEQDGKQVSLIARGQGRRGFGLELELARTTLGDDDKQRSAGGALFKSFGKRRLAPYVLVGAGGGRLERADGNEQRLRYAEFGGGLMLRGKRLAIGIDIRRGVRRLDALDHEAMTPMDVSPAMVTSPNDDGDRDRYTRGRILAMFQF